MNLVVMADQSHEARQVPALDVARQNPVHPLQPGSRKTGDVLLLSLRHQRPSLVNGRAHRVTCSCRALAQASSSLRNSSSRTPASTKNFRVAVVTVVTK